MLAADQSPKPSPHVPAPGRAGRAQTWTLVIAGIGAFMAALDTLVVTTALPTLRVDLGASLPELEWTVNAYNLAFACMLLTGAALGDRFGRRRMFAIGLFVFSAASAASALAPSVSALIAARAAQGVGAAIVTPLTLTLISETFPARTRSAAIGLWAGITGLAVAAGPLVGGAVVDGLDWHWIFWLNVPIGLALIPLARRRLGESFGASRRLDARGVALAAAGAFGLTWGLVRASAAGWGSAEVVASLGAGVALLAAFIAWERRAPSPMLKLTLFRRRAFAAANAVSLLMYAGLMGATFLMAQFLQTALGDTPLDAGLKLLPWTAPPILVAPLAGALAGRYGSRPFMALGLSLQAVGLAWIALIAAPGIGYAQLGLAFAIAGVGISLCFPTVAAAVMGSVAPAEAGVASGTNSALRQLGGVLGVALLATVFAGQGGYGSPSAFVDGFRDALWVAVGLSALGVAAALCVPGRRRRSGSAASRALTRARRMSPTA